MFEQGNTDRHRVRFGVQLLIALLVTVGCGPNATDERSVEDRSDAVLRTQVSNQTPDPLRSSRRPRTR